MSIKNTLLAGVAGTLLAGTAMAAEPMKLTNAQLDDVAAGFTITAGLALIGPFNAIGQNQLQFTELSQVATVEQINLTTTSLAQVQQTQSAAGLTVTTMAGNGSVFESGGSLAVGISLSAPSFP